MLGFKIKYRSAERGHPRKIVLVPVHRPDEPPRHAAVDAVDEGMPDTFGRDEPAASSVH
jgi:hypothetical protein